MPHTWDKDELDANTGKIKKLRKPEEAGKELNRMDNEVKQVVLSQSEKLRKRSRPPRSAKLNEALLNHLMWKIAVRGIKTKRCFRERLN